MEDPMIDRAGDIVGDLEPKELEEANDQDTPPQLDQTYPLEEVFQNLEHKGEDKNFLAREADKAGVDFDNKNQQIEPDEDDEEHEVNYDKEETDPDVLRDERDL